MATRDLGVRLSNIDPQEVIRLGKIADASPVWETSEAEKTLKSMAAAYRHTNGLLATVPGLTESKQIKLADEARRYLNAYAPSRIRNIDANRP